MLPLPGRSPGRGSKWLHSTAGRVVIGQTLIRADQGHSIPVDVELPAAVPPKVFYHGTGEKYAASILQQGLIPKSRLYVHLSADPETAVKVGLRHGKPVVFTVDISRMHQEGSKFYLSVNGVWLTEEVPTSCLRVFRDSETP